MKISLIQLEGRAISAYEETYQHILNQVEQVCLTDTDLILLPECSFPGYCIGLAESDAWHSMAWTLTDEISKLASIYQKYIAIGLALPEGEKLYNSLLLFDRCGAQIGRADKNNLWHFDSSWFTHGSLPEVADTEFGKVGLMVCADGRIPEVARSLALKGAQLILDTVNLVAAAPEPEQLMNQQYAYILKTRARENGVYIAVCNKCGIEDDSVTMLGRSFIVSPTGQILAAAPPDAENVLTWEIPLYPQSDAVSVSQRQHRDPELYLPITDQTIPRENPYLSQLEHYTGIVSYAFTDFADYAEKARRFSRIAHLQHARIAVFPLVQGANPEYLKELSACLHPQVISLIGFFHEGHCGCAVYHHGYPPHIFFSSSARHEVSVVELTPGMNVAFLFGDELELPELAHVAMLRGADLVVWFDTEERNDEFPLVQTRAAENKFFVVRMCSTRYNCYIVNPDGVQITSTFRERDHFVAGMIYTALSRCKTVVPGTNIQTTRHPEDYTELTKG